MIRLQWLQMLPSLSRQYSWPCLPHLERHHGYQSMSRGTAFHRDFCFGIRICGLPARAETYTVNAFILCCRSSYCRKQARQGRNPQLPQANPQLRGLPPHHLLEWWTCLSLPWDPAPWCLQTRQLEHKWYSCICSLQGLCLTLCRLLPQQQVS